MSVSTEIRVAVETHVSGAQAPGRKRAAAASVSLRLLGYIALAVASVGLLLPFVWMLVSSLKRNIDVFTVPIQWIPDPVVWENYLTIWQRTNMGTWLGNTLFISVIVTVLQVLTGAFAAYGFARVRFPGRDILFLAYIGTIAVPWQAIMIPQFIMMSNWGLANTRWSIILLQAFGAFGVFLMKQYFESIPESLNEAARIDGLNEYGIWWRIMMPLSVPAIASLTLLTFVNTWNDFLGPLLYLRDNSLWTVQVGLRTFIGQFASEHAMIMTGSVLSVLPIAIIFFLGQRYFVEGIASTGVKG
ncbi:MAG: carbohydrate ABC transporter permease [Cellulomonadaceae bacterium]|jgi:multiple sugar transport system permease protein|nr:carbohydrate ABC transporter permease [Cellulomonadaceae bacterium]